MRFGAIGVALVLLEACTATTRIERPRAPVGVSEAEAEVSPEPPEAGAIPENSPAAEPNDEPEEPDDDTDEAEPEQFAGEQRSHPLDGWTDERVAEAVNGDLPSLGSMSVGNPSAGMLVNGRNAKPSELYRPVAAGSAWATDETLAYLDAALTKVHATIADTPVLPLGDISVERGGPLSPHLSHQSGRDVDIGYFYRGEQRWYRRGNAQNLDLERNWAFVRALVTETDVDLIFIDHSIQALLREHAISHGENRAWVEGLFGGGGQRAIIRHARGHATHVHVRFFNPVAQETARRSYGALVARGVVPPVQSFLQHRVKRGETLGKIAKKYRVSVQAIKRANRLKKSLIREKRTYLIPIAHPRPAPPSKRLAFPPRRLPPAPAQNLAADSTGRRP